MGFSFTKLFGRKTKFVEEPYEVTRAKTREALDLLKNSKKDLVTARKAMDAYSRLDSETQKNTPFYAKILPEKNIYSAGSRLFEGYRKFDKGLAAFRELEEQVYFEETETSISERQDRLAAHLQTFLDERDKIVLGDATWHIYGHNSLDRNKQCFIDSVNFYCGEIESLEIDPNRYGSLIARARGYTTQVANSFEPVAV